MVPASVIYGTVVGGFMFSFVRFVAETFMRSGETRPPNIVGTPSSLGQFAEQTDRLALPGFLPAAQGQLAFMRR